ncbi:hypothetical protein CERZMDRAFT_102061 [Cercospora zeae-maydis SCOH1-5]|uniref:Uncharacterized protein n=1 Tax=Cercospora zeae-maydis SCOH1-5 TaxID=717836 RepID=A0A6A6F1I5_9PEZI|nr:hypothetical protein CERZMDRAFT_102061 [Cercospora zeae-maydis SCOH1-5]
MRSWWNAAAVDWPSIPAYLQLICGHAAMNVSMNARPVYVSEQRPARASEVLIVQENCSVCIFIYRLSQWHGRGALSAKKKKKKKKKKGTGVYSIQYGLEKKIGSSDTSSPVIPE